MRHERGPLILVLALLVAASASAEGLRVPPARQGKDCAFAGKPVVTGSKDRWTIRFEVKAFCDVALAIEDAEGRIVRHLASGVLGKNAPAPFRKNALKQEVIWDGKDDLGRYVAQRTADYAKYAVRVSLGLKPRLEKTLYWSPAKRTRGPAYITNPPVMVAAPEGVYVYDGGNCDHIRLFDHKGDYVRTIYPFPSDKISAVQGLNWRTFPQDGARLPIKGNMPVCNTLLDPKPTGTGANCYKLAMAVHGKRLVISGRRLNRLSTEGGSGGLHLLGPRTSVTARLPGFMYFKGATPDMSPQSIALSPNGKWAYLTGYGQENYGNGQWLCGVTRVPVDGPPALLSKGKMEPEPEVFAGIMECPRNIEALIKGKKLEPKSRDTLFKLPSSVACDAEGRVYVTDYMGDCIQVFSPDAKLLKRIDIKRPAQVQIHPGNGEIFVLCWQVANHLTRDRKDRVPWVLRRLGPLSNPKALASFALPADLRIDHFKGSACIDFWAEPFTVWVAGGSNRKASGNSSQTGKEWVGTCPRLYVPKDGKLVPKRHLGHEGFKKIAFMRPVRHGYQKLYFDHKNEKLYVGEVFAPHVFHVTGMVHVARIDPDRGRVSVVALPFDAEDMAFDMEGRAYLRSADAVVRYDARTWREVPFDYGEETMVSSQGMRRAAVVSAVRFAGQLGIASSQMGGMNVSPRGDLIVTACNRGKSKDRKGSKSVHGTRTKRYTPRLYPGRARPWEIHVWDPHGKIRYADAVQGIACYMNGVAMDRQDGIYVMLAANGLLSGKRYWNTIACTWLKVRPDAKLLSKAGAPIPLPPQQHPKRPNDFGEMWAEDPEWYRAGVGIDGKRAGCHCMSHCRPALDYYARSFLPEVDRYSVLVLDTNGNEIVRIGRYGNVDDGMPLVKEGGPPNPRSIGGDEIAIAHNQMLAVHSDRRLFIGDLGNACIRGVKLDYHATERVRLKQH